mgnify:CR=1 FL=1
MNKKAAIIAGVAIVGLLGAFTLGGKDKAQETEVKGTEIVAVQDENGTIEVTKNPERVVTFDGETGFALYPGDKVVITKHPECAIFAKTSKISFLQRIRDKMMDH